MDEQSRDGGLRVRLSRGGQALRMAWESAPATAGAWIAVIGLVSVLPLAVAWVGKAIVDAVVAGALQSALTWVVVELLLMALLGASQRGAGVLRSLLGIRLALFINLKILRKALTLELLQFQDPEFYDRLTRARREASSRPLLLAAELLGLISAVVTLLGFIALLLSFSPLAVLVLIAAAFPAALAELRFSREAFDMRNRRATEARKLSYYEYVLASDEHAKEVMMLGLGPTLLGRYEAVGERLFREERSLSLRRTLWVTLLAQIGTLSFYACYLLIVWRAVRGELGLGDMTLYVIAFRQGQMSFQSILLGLGSLHEHELYMSNLLGFLTAPPARAVRALPPAPTTPEPPAERGIRFENVGFRYPGRDDFALRNINLTIPAGQTLALVGPNGAGKTTFIKLLTGLYEPTEGRVLLDGIDLQSLPQDELRRRLSVVFQDFNQYQLSARENVGYGDPPHIGDRARIERAVDEGGAGPVIDSLPAGLETQLGRWFPGGVDLSGGQWQRVALARAFMRIDADVLVLDEPTAALDIDAEAEVFERVRALSAGRTLLLISHRFANVRLADRIVVLEKSGVVEAGTHASLMVEDGLYAAMFRKQAKGYA
ncbi:MAG: ABC transporter ATP-binding protein [Polyangiaceae bacterium]|nr:ABC transporter ATP-binding protein [Polyangiaceae bacterium]